MKIEHLTIINGVILMVCDISSQSYQYEIVVSDGLIYQPNEIYKTANQARDVGIERIKIVLGSR